MKTLATTKVPLALVLGALACGGTSGVANEEAAVGAASVSPATGAASGRIARKVQLSGEGVVDLRYVVPPVAAPPPPPGLEYRGRFAFPTNGKDVLDSMIFAAPIGAPNGVEPVFIISHWLTRIDAFETSRTPDNNLRLIGRVTETPVASPFGPIAGRLSAFTGGYTEGSHATFTLVGWSVSASHTTLLPAATGSLTLRHDEDDD